MAVSRRLAWRWLVRARVEVYVTRAEERRSPLACLVHRGPLWAEVHAVEEHDADMRTCGAFQIK
jgi:hypothetical protein